MSKAYLINNSVIFNPELHYLRRRVLTAPTDVIQLNVPASRCFELLLSHRYKVMSQKTLFEFVWEQQGVFVSANTLYQNISLLRKALKSLDLDDIVKTISKQGLVIAETVNVQEIEEERIDLTLVSPALPTPPLLQVQNRKGKKWLGSNTFLIALIVIAIVLITLSIADRYQHQTHMGFFDHYTQFTEINGCAIFRPGTGNTEEKYLSFVKNHPIKCEAQSKVYLTIPKGKPQVSMIICDRDILTSGAKCRSYNLLREQSYD